MSRFQFAEIIFMTNYTFCFGAFFFESNFKPQFYYLSICLLGYGNLVFLSVACNASIQTIDDAISSVLNVIDNTNFDSLYQSYNAEQSNCFFFAEICNRIVREQIAIISILIWRNVIRISKFSSDRHFYGTSVQCYCFET